MMTESEPQYVVDRADSSDYEPMMIEGVHVGEDHWLRTVGSHGNPHEACLWRTSAPARYEYLFTGDESFYVLESSVTIELVEPGERIELKAGDMASFAKGIQSVSVPRAVQEIHSDFGLVVVPGGPAQADENG
jgi:uncharacterized cupin superfamily protein